jgi:hypothetical protein
MWDRREAEGEAIRPSDISGPLVSHLSVCFSAPGFDKLGVARVCVAAAGPVLEPWTDFFNYYLRNKSDKKFFLSLYVVAIHMT